MSRTRTRARIRPGISASARCNGCFLGGVPRAIEIAQLFLPGRHRPISDFLVDAAAACFGLLTAVRVLRSEIFFGKAAHLPRRLCLWRPTRRSIERAMRLPMRMGCRKVLVEKMEQEGETSGFSLIANRTVAGSSCFTCAERDPGARRRRWRASDLRSACSPAAGRAHARCDAPP